MVGAELEVGPRDGSADGEDDGLSVGAILGLLLGWTETDGSALGTVLGIYGTCFPPPHEQHASSTFFPWYQIELNVSQKPGVTFSQPYPFASFQYQRG